MIPGRVSGVQDVCVNFWWWYRGYCGGAARDQGRLTSNALSWIVSISGRKTLRLSDLGGFTGASLTLVNGSQRIFFFCSPEETLEEHQWVWQRIVHKERIDSTKNYSGETQRARGYHRGKKPRSLRSDSQFLLSSSGNVLLRNKCAGVNKIKPILLNSIMTFHWGWPSLRWQEFVT